MGWFSRWRQRKESKKNKTSEPKASYDLYNDSQTQNLGLDEGNDVSVAYEESLVNQFNQPAEEMNETPMMSMPYSNDDAMAAMAEQMPMPEMPAAESMDMMEEPNFEAAAEDQEMAMPVEPMDQMMSDSEASVETEMTEEEMPMVSMPEMNEPEVASEMMTEETTTEIKKTRTRKISADKTKTKTLTTETKKKKEDSQMKTKTTSTSTPNSGTSRNIYYVSIRKDKDGKKQGWEVKKEKAGRITKLCATKEEAISLVKSLAENQGSTCIIRKADGSIQETLKFDKK